MPLICTFYTVIAKQLPQFFFMVSNAVVRYQADEIPLGKAFQCRFHKMRILAEIAVRRHLHIGEITKPTAGH